MKIVMTTLFGIEAAVADELQELGYDRAAITVQDGQVLLDVGSDSTAIKEAVAKTNIWLSTAERVLLKLAEFPVPDFDHLFDQTAELPWEQWIRPGMVILVKGYSRKSQLFGVPSCQRLIKKAIVKRLLRVHDYSDDATWPEDQTNNVIQIQFGIVQDRIHLMVDTSGDGLHKRGYRPLQHQAPIRETLAAAMLRFAHFRPNSGETLLDPCCGSGTIAIEAALIASGRAPGLHRSFAAESWFYIGKEPFTTVRQEAQARPVISPPDRPQIYGSDISADAVAIARSNAERAGLADWIGWQCHDLYDLNDDLIREWTGSERLLILCNPPYGERLLDEKKARQLYQLLSRVFLENGGPRPDVRFFLITPFTGLEKLLGQPATRRRKLYNGMIRCTLYQYFGQRSKGK